MPRIPHLPKPARLLCLAALAGPALRLMADDVRVDFTNHVKPILASRCVACHSSGALFGELNLENRALAFKKRERGPAILPGRPESSPLYQVLRLPPRDPRAMPPTGHRIPDSEVQTLRAWIRQGALWPTGPAGAVPPPASPGGDPP